MTKKLLISDELLLPLDFVVERIAFLGRTDKDGSASMEGISLPADPNGLVLSADEEPVAWSTPMNKTLAEVEREHILRIFKASDCNHERAAVTLGISSRTLYRKLREYAAQDNSVILSIR